MIPCEVNASNVMKSLVSRNDHTCHLFPVVTKIRTCPLLVYGRMNEEEEGRKKIALGRKNGGENGTGKEGRVTARTKEENETSRWKKKRKKEREDTSKRRKNDKLTKEEQQVFKSYYYIHSLLYWLTGTVRPHL